MGDPFLAVGGLPPLARGRGGRCGFLAQTCPARCGRPARGLRARTEGRSPPGRLPVLRPRPGETRSADCRCRARRPRATRPRHPLRPEPGSAPAGVGECPRPAVGADPSPRAGWRTSTSHRLTTGTPCGGPWRSLANARLAHDTSLGSNQPRNLGASREQGIQHPTGRPVRPDRMVEGRAGEAGQPARRGDGPAAAVHRHLARAPLDRAGGDPARSGAPGAGGRVHRAARPCRHH